MSLHKRYMVWQLSLDVPALQNTADFGAGAGRRMAKGVQSREADTAEIPCCRNSVSPVAG